MKTKTTFLASVWTAVLLLAATTPGYALNYTISFTASGVTNSVGSVQVQNLTKGTTVTVPEGNTLTLTDQATAVDELKVNNAGIRISQNASTGISTLSFNATKAGSAQVAAYTFDGRKAMALTSRLEVGENSFELSLPVGMYVLRVSGAGCTYSTKFQSLANTGTLAGIKFLSNKKAEVLASQKIKAIVAETTTLAYATGDQLLYTATSGGYIASVPDAPAGSKTTNFVFATIPTSAIPAGSFTMGSPATEVGRNADETQHTVTLTAFRLSKYVITNTQYAAFLNAKSISSDGLYASAANPVEPLIYATSGNYDWGLHYVGTQWIPAAGYENAPVIYVTWYGATEYAKYIGGVLPTEAQWEYACRAGTTTPFNTGNFLTNQQSNYNWAHAYNGGINTVTTSPGTTQSVGTYAPNAYGLYDMHGNVYQWCSDWYGTYPTAVQTNPTGPVTGSFPVIRGGGWCYYAQACRSASRNYIGPDNSATFIGFRVVIMP